MEGKTITIEKATRLLCREYEIAKNLEMVKNPVAYALYKVWKKADGERRTDNERKADKDI